MKHVVIVVFGRVQGVYFRATTKQQADKLGVSGWVRNRRNGTVEISATGSEEQLRSLISWCHEGPVYSEVTEVKVVWSEVPVATKSGFAINPSV